MRDPDQNWDYLWGRYAYAGIHGNIVIMAVDGLPASQLSAFEGMSDKIHYGISNWDEVRVALSTYPDQSIDYLVLAGHGNPDGGVTPTGSASTPLTAATLDGDTAEMIRRKLKTATFTQRWGYIVNDGCCQADIMSSAGNQTLSDVVQRPVLVSSGMVWDDLESDGGWYRIYPR